MKWKQRKWKLQGLTGESLGLTICWHKSTEAGQDAEYARSPPTPAVCAACRRRGLGLDKAASGNESFCSVPVFNSQTSLSNSSLHSNVCPSEGSPRTTEPKTHLGGREEKCSCPPSAQARTRLPRSPLYRSKNFPTIQSLLSKSSAAEGLGGVTPCAFRKHMLRLKPELKKLVPALAQADSDADMEVKTQAAREASASDASAHASASPHAAVVSDLSPNDKLQDPRAATTPASARDRNRGSDTKEIPKRAVKRRTQYARKDEDAGEEDADEDLPLCSMLLKLKEKPARKKEAAVEDGKDEDDLPLPPRARLLKKEQKAPKGEEHGEVGVQKEWEERVNPDVECSAEASARAPQPSAAIARDLLSAEKKRKQGLDILQHTDGSEARDARSLPTEGGGCYERKRWKVVHFVETQRSDGSLAMTLRIKRKRAADKGV